MAGNHSYGGSQGSNIYLNTGMSASGQAPPMAGSALVPPLSQQQMHGQAGQTAQQQNTQQSNMLPQSSGGMLSQGGSSQLPSNVPGSQQGGQLPKEVNSVSLCRLGQEIVHDTVQRAADIFGILKTISLPNGASYNVQQYQEKKNKLDDQMRILNLGFRKLRIISEKVEESTGPREAMFSSENLIPICNKEYNTEFLRDAEKNNLYQIVSEEHRDMVERIQLKSRQLKEVIDHIRTIIWEINTMITMRKTG
ncbi:mediator of RNA polymerase II transcription subunit 30 [Octopus bimaculoides]|uniref:Mediator of RNA polymerase II transcription subunit 30 n=1 Tax=Octopus bimaculoides TaxID=37653 RepID=A0A0L8GYE1_OCTBM|nr:mediator of RNA polymerase II transcription subunit 30 [Octopus bimaculoides]|eukprot:XP_014777008.1 PREDICTED: mediator of RNA polymerase II transcription subunit 30-like [Octopus bimaculoides]